MSITNKEIIENFVIITSKASISAFKYVGKKDKIAADKWNGEVLLHQPEIDYWFLTHSDVESFEWIVMDCVIENKLTS